MAGPTGAGHRTASRRGLAAAAALLAAMGVIVRQACSGSRAGPSDAELAEKLRAHMQVRRVVILERQVEFQTHRVYPPPPPGDDGTEYQVRTKITKADGSVWQPILRIFASARTGEVILVGVASSNAAPPRPH